MANRKIYVTASEMLKMREEGMSNRDIANSLDISYGTVVKYIGKQGGRMESLEAFKDKPKKAEAEAETKAVIPPYEPKPVTERYKFGMFDVELDTEDRDVTIVTEEDVLVIPYDFVPDLVQFLAWAMRTRMEVSEDADKLQAEGSEI